MNKVSNGFVDLPFTTFQTPEYIMNEWSIHFGQLAKTSTTENVDNDYLKLMEQEMDVIMQICLSLSNSTIKK
jgi:hypothetical protein